MTCSKRDERNERWLSLYQQAHQVANDAASACTPTPMVVEKHANMLDDNSPVKKAWVVDGGVCGFAWVVIKPANSSFALWCKKNRQEAVSRNYYGGLSIHADVGGQSMEIKEAWAYAFAGVLQNAGIEAYGQSRMD